MSNPTLARECSGRRAMKRLWQCSGHGAFLTLMSILAFGLVMELRADTYVWSNGGGDWLWSNGANWTNGSAPNVASNNALVFGVTGAGMVTNDIVGNFNLSSLTFSNNYTVEGNRLDWAHNESISIVVTGVTVNINCPTFWGGTTPQSSPSGSTLIFNGVMAGSHSATISGNGTVRYTNAGNTQSGTLTVGSQVSNGRLEFTSAGALGAGAVTVQLSNYLNANNSAVLAYIGTGNANVSAGLTYGGAGNNKSLTVANNSPDNGNLTLSGVLTFADRGNLETVYSEFTGTSTGTTTVTGVFRDHAYLTNITRTGIKLDSSGTLTLTGTNVYTGPTVVTNGTLLVDGITESNGAYTVYPGGTLGGTGMISGATTIMAGGRIAPGDGGAGTLTITNTLDITALATNNSGGLLFDLGADSDKVVLMTQALTIGSGLLGARDFMFTGNITRETVLFQTDVAIIGTLDASDLKTVQGAILALSSDGTDIVLRPSSAGTLIRIQ